MMHDYSQSAPCFTSGFMHITRCRRLKVLNNSAEYCSDRLFQSGMFFSISAMYNQHIGNRENMKKQLFLSNKMGHFVSCGVVFVSKMLGSV